MISFHFDLETPEYFRVQRGLVTVGKLFVVGGRVILSLDGEPSRDFDSFDEAKDWLESR